ncbi:hypothetical protein PUN28_016133 [Cardiocondyla obscurior]|uniref:Uncharacterized protein n=1 Tax=Cardiocondyla obscurior TaxID=286306 RepID=A0AAW2ES97_9HYME
MLLQILQKPAKHNAHKKFVRKKDSAYKAIPSLLPYPPFVRKRSNLKQIYRVIKTKKIARIIIRIRYIRNARTNLSK